MNYCICVVKSASDDNVIFSTLKGLVQRLKKIDPKSGQVNLTCGQGPNTNII